MKTLCPICQNPINSDDPFVTDEKLGWQKAHFDCYFPPTPEDLADAPQPIPDRQKHPYGRPKSES
jgi:hypothetical protein